MFLENLVFDAVDPGRTGRFWEAVVGGEQLTDAPEGYETRLAVDGGPTLDLCFQRVPDLPDEALRLHLDLHAGDRLEEEVERILGLGATHADVGQGDVPWVVLADPQGTPFCVMPDRPGHPRAGTGPIASLPLDSADPVRDAAFWSWLTGWTATGDDPTVLRHPSGRGPELGLCDELAPKGAAKNRLHLDVRLEEGDDPEAVEAGILERGGTLLVRPEWGDLPWRSYADPSGNELCVLRHSGGGAS